MLAMSEELLDSRSLLSMEGWNDYEENYVIYSDLGAEIECDNLLPDMHDDSDTEQTAHHHNNKDCTIPSVSPSLASSDCSDLDNLLEEDLSFTSDGNETNIHRSINEECLLDSKDSYINNTDMPPIKEWRNFSMAYVEHFESVKWSRMGSDNQVEVLQEITQIVSQKLGLREQLELINLISPDADVSPKDDEFFIDLDLFNDCNFRKVCSYVRQQLKLLDSGPPKSKLYGASKNGRKKRMDNNEKALKRKLKPQTIWPQRRKSPANKKILDKTHKQIKKEKRSGLFAQEQVISIPKKDEEIEDDIEIDILD